MLILFLTVAMVHLVALMSPGPGFFFVSQTAASLSRKETMPGVLGISMGIVIWSIKNRHHGRSKRWSCRAMDAASCGVF